ncbi:hypothetical protein ACL02T_09735 [Pseudonocardia sp. RS010]|uniref:hypothetical protein n=1 Tax=Pseudonocardia sp. RS010 TaxID=3385979 RepID=UPI0039A1552C
MPNLADLFDAYSRRARLYPVLLVTMPIGCSVVLLWPGLGWDKVAPIALAAGLPFFATSMIRSAGKRLEDRLVVEWDGMPTTRMLRLRDTAVNTELRRRRRAKLAALTGDPLPTADEEAADPRRADECYVAAVRVLITKVRDDKDKHPRLHDENAEYGFRRNLLAAKPVALVLLGALLVADGVAVVLGRDIQAVGLAAAIHIVLILAWSLAVRRRWVTQQANTYAERLFETLEHAAPATEARPTT